MDCLPKAAGAVLLAGCVCAVLSVFGTIIKTLKATVALSLLIKMS